MCDDYWKVVEGRLSGSRLSLQSKTWTEKLYSDIICDTFGNSKGLGDECKQSEHGEPQELK